MKFTPQFEKRALRDLDVVAALRAAGVGSASVSKKRHSNKRFRDNELPLYHIPDEHRAVAEPEAKYKL